MTTSIHITTTVTDGELAYFRRDAERLQVLLARCRTCDVRLEEEAGIAEIVLFVGSMHRGLQDVRASCIFRKDPSKCFIVHGGDDPLPTVPGIYASVPSRWYDPLQHRAGFYLRTALHDPTDCFADIAPEYLFSFVGAGANHPVREQILALQGAGGLFIDSARDPVPPCEAKARFVESLRASLFVLCPRGGGTSSFRIFETMMAGRVPVIISDDWVEPKGPNWGQFALRVREREVAAIPKMLEEAAGLGLDMGRRARQAWEVWFSPQTAGATLFSWVMELKAGMDDKGRQPVAPGLAALAAADSMRMAFGRVLRGRWHQGRLES
ncbi:hypothetical protein CKO25_10520 [Thiocapsa imhoffii]|uniref:Exostosin GT47 domain-containing protein n=1 Tax=Thiocapsa imhoffii TaxID=382777 RepID=A0A9X1B998_9GAMM|nr:exostosin family protein [Thiocapsa imhoffii]MBK1645078.1 hypothetical protein [Thiocapsa imhoffii]